MKKYIMGIDIGGTKCAVLLGRAQGDADDIIIDKLRFETRVGRGWRAVTEELLDNVEEIIKKNALSPRRYSLRGDKLRRSARQQARSYSCAAESPRLGVRADSRHD